MSALLIQDINPGSLATPSALPLFWLCVYFSRTAPIFRCGDVSLAVSNLDMHALFVLGDLRAKLVKQFQSRFVYITEQNAEGIYIAEIDTESALVVDDKPGLKLKVGDHF